MEAMARGRGMRRHDLDWLRVFGVLTVFVYHSLRFFDLGDWSVKNATTYAAVSALTELIAVWMMPLIFVVSGASIFYASRKSAPAAFLRDKVLRLLVPLLVGVFTFSIGQVYLERLSHGQFRGSFFAFVPHYFEGVYLPGGTGNFAFHGLHLWYLLMLFVLTVALVPLFVWLRSAPGEKALRALADLMARPGLIVLLAVPTIVLQNLTENGAFAFGLGGWRLVQYVWFFLAGYVIVSHERLQERIVQARWAALGLAVAVPALSLAGGAGLATHPDLAVWPGLVAILGFAMARLTFRNRFLDHANEAVLPFYILHQNVLLLVGFFVVGWALPDPAKHALIASASFLTIALVYEYAVRRSTPVRVLFGMKPLPADPVSKAVLAA